MILKGELSLFVRVKFKTSSISLLNISVSSNVSYISRSTLHSFFFSCIKLFMKQSVCGYMLSLPNVFIGLFSILKPRMTKKCLSNYKNKRLFYGLYRCVSARHMKCVFNALRPKS